MTEPECEIVADAGTRLRIIADGLLSNALVLDTMGQPGADAYRLYARMVDETRVRLCALPIENEGGEEQ